MKESTAKGRHNWHHEDWLVGESGQGRFLNVFIPWYAEEKKNWLPAPIDWTPSEETLAHACRAEQDGPRWLHRSVTLTRHQLYWYEQERGVAVAKGQLAKFLEEQAADPDECFQHSGRSIFTISQLQQIERSVRPPIDVWTVAPAASLGEVRAEELAAIRKAKSLAVEQMPAEDTGVLVR